MSALTALFSIDVEHEYYADNVCHDIEIMVDDKTTSLFKRYGLFLRHHQGGLTVYVDASQTDVVKMLANEKPEAVTLVFKARAINSRLSVVSEPLAQAEDEILCFSSNNAKKSRQAGSDAWVVHDKAFTAKGDVKKVQALLEQGILEPHELYVKPFFVFSVDMKRFRTVTAIKASPRFLVRLRTKRTQWLYYFTMKKPFTDVFISDLDKQEVFDYHGESRLANNRVARTYLSKSSLPLLEKPGYRFQLREKNVAGERILMARLPLASGEAYGRALVDGKSVAVSEIYVNC